MLLFKKVRSNNLTDLIAIIGKFFDHELNSSNPSISMINNFLEKVPSLGRTRKPFLTRLLNITIDSCKMNSNPSFNDYYSDSDNDNDDENKENKELILLIINSFAPERKEDLQITPSDLNEIDFSFSYSTTNEKLLSQSNLKYFENKIPPKIMNADPTFWNLFKKQINLIDKIISKDKKMVTKLSFLIEFPEIMSFKTRSFIIIE